MNVIIIYYSHGQVTLININENKDYDHDHIIEFIGDQNRNYRNQSI